jgi:hypothetical protein
MFIYIYEEFEDIKGVIKSVNRRTDNTMAKRTKGQTAIYKTYT